MTGSPVARRLRTAPAVALVAAWAAAALVATAATVVPRRSRARR